MPESLDYYLAVGFIIVLCFLLMLAVALAMFVVTDEARPAPRPAPPPDEPEDSPNKKAKALFLRMLTDEQRRQYFNHSQIRVIGSRGNLYTVLVDEVAIAGNIIGPRHRRYCVYPRGVPYYDAILAQILMLQADERHVLDRAN